MTTVPLVIGVTSHRNIPAREMEAIWQRVRDFFARLRSEYPGLPLVVLSSLAEGGDQWVAEEAIASGIRLIAPLPLKRAQYALDFESGAARERYEYLCDKAELIEIDPATSPDNLMNKAAAGDAIKARNDPAAAYDATAKTCNGVYCHSSGQATPRAPRS